MEEADKGIEGPEGSPRGFFHATLVRKLIPTRAAISDRINSDTRQTVED